MLHALLTSNAYRHNACKYMPLQDLCEDYVAYRQSKGQGTLRYKDWLNEYEGTFEELGLVVISEERQYPPDSGQKLNTQWVLGVAKNHLYAFLADDNIYEWDVHLYMPLEDLRNGYIKYRASKGKAAQNVADAEWREQKRELFEEIGFFATFSEHEYPPNSGQRLNTHWVMGIAPRRLPAACPAIADKGKN